MPFQPGNRYGRQPAPLPWIVTDRMGAVHARVDGVWHREDAERMARAIQPEIEGLAIVPWHRAIAWQRTDAAKAYAITEELYQRAGHAAREPQPVAQKPQVGAAAAQLRRRFAHTTAGGER